jgi:hypothetical protein
MMQRVFRLRHNDQILNAIIKLITVDVMNALRRIEFSTKMIFHYEPVFSDILILASHHLVSGRSECSRAVWSSLKDVWVTIPPKALPVLVAKIFRNRAIRASLDFTNRGRASVIQSFSHPAQNHNYWSSCQHTR